MPKPANVIQLRLVVETEDFDAAVGLAPPTETPWRSLNSRLEAPAGLQITLFEALEPLDVRQ